MTAIWPPEQTLTCYGCESAARYSLGMGHVPPRWKMVKLEGRYRPFCGTCAAALEAQGVGGEGAKVVFVPRRKFRKGK